MRYSAEPSDDVGSQQPLRVRLVVNWMSDTDEFRASRLRAKRLDLAGGVAPSEIDPADDSCHERIRVGEAEQPAGFIEVGSSLDGDRQFDIA